ncbi:MAG: 3-phosphoserine/phosphohydroxythreonine transaminase [Chthonomonadales bacterium]|nr:3-phosphoserine/phosphohydroxythreonine transaminase [Chthonomonadales bacterium]
MTRAINFNAGPSALPESVLQRAAEAVREIGGSGMSILEISHRAEPFLSLHRDAQDRLLALLGLSRESFTVLFLGGGASLQFLMLPMNFLSADVGADYVDTGTWATKAIAEARRLGPVRVAASSEGDRYARIPEVDRVDPSSRYLHITTNNTIEGTQWRTLPDAGAIPLVADMSSDILSMPRDFGRFSLIYAGAQKNLGPAGVTIVLIKRSFLETASDNLPPMLSYRVQHAEDSLYNTPPVFGIYVVGLVCRWIEEQGGLASVAEHNAAKAQCVYDALDAYPDVFEPTVAIPEHRSQMNITFRLRDPSVADDFLKGARALGMVGLKGHRSVGGFRASLYNAVPLEAAARLAEYLTSFARR